MKRISGYPSLCIAAANVVPIAALLSYIPAANAEENGSTQWPVGVQTVIPAIMPPPDATEFYQYNLYYSASSYKNGQGQTVYPNIGVDAYANANRLIHTWSTTLAGFNFSSAAIIAEDGTRVKLGSSFEQTNVGIDYIYLTPLYVTYQWGDVHFLAGGSVFIPVAPYDPNRLANASLNYYAYNQELAVTWFPTQKWEVSAEAEIAFNFRNPATQYLSGNLLNVDFGIGYKPFDALPGLQIGLAGFLTEQLSSDQTATQYVPGGNYLRKFGLGPQIVYYMTPASALVFKWERELDARNAPKGDRVWFEFAIPVGG